MRLLPSLSHRALADFVAGTANGLTFSRHSDGTEQVKGCPMSSYTSLLHRSRAATNEVKVTYVVATVSNDFLLVSHMIQLYGSKNFEADLWDGVIFLIIAATIVYGAQRWWDTNYSKVIMIVILVNLCYGSGYAACIMGYDESLKFLDLEFLEYCHPSDCGIKYEIENSPQQETIHPPQQEKKGIVYALKMKVDMSAQQHNTDQYYNVMDNLAFCYKIAFGFYNMFFIVVYILEYDLLLKKLLEGGGDEYTDNKRSVETTAKRHSFDRLFFTLYSLYIFIPLSSTQPFPLPPRRRSTTANPTACSTFASGSGSKSDEGCCCDPRLVYIGLNLRKPTNLRFSFESENYMKSQRVPAIHKNWLTHPTTVNEIVAVSLSPRVGRLCCRTASPSRHSDGTKQVKGCPMSSFTFLPDQSEVTETYVVATVSNDFLLVSHMIQLYGSKKLESGLWVGVVLLIIAAAFVYGAHRWWDTNYPKVIMIVILVNLCSGSGYAACIMAYDESLKFFDFESLNYSRPGDCGTKYETENSHQQETKYETENSPQQEIIHPPQQEKKGIVTRIDDVLIINDWKTADCLPPLGTTIPKLPVLFWEGSCASLSIHDGTKQV
ncbi:hypothetical protein Syun_011230 [Stephania yunnanensis]|uniref:Uncharacterized protein n=1 Tax=Stephania yunnanensis TaxID=152371 RepID=A0AAP0JY63_9MAGN